MSARHLPRPLARRLDRLARRAHLFHRYAHHPLCAAYAGETVRLGRRTRLCRGCAWAALGAAIGVAAAFALPVPPGPALLGGAALLGPALLAAVRPRGGGRAPALPEDRAWPRGGGRAPALPEDRAWPRGAGRAPALPEGRAWPRGAWPSGGGRAPALPEGGARRAAGTPAGGKLLTRGAPACAVAALALSGLRARSLAGLLAAALALGATAWAVRAYRRRGPDRRRCEACPERALPRCCSGFAPIARREAAFAQVAGRLLRAVPPPPPAR